MEKSTKKRVRNVVLGVTSMALVAGITASLTLAYLTDTDSKKNVFTNDPSITAKLTETKWDGDDTGNFDGTDNTKATDDNAKVIFDNASATADDFGINQANGYLPGDTINKNPVVTNTNQNESEYVALKLKYGIDLNSNGSIDSNEYLIYDKFQKVAKLGDINSAWTTGAGSINYDGTFYYGTYDGSEVVLTELQKGQSTAALFETVTVDKGLAYGEEITIGEFKYMSVEAVTTDSVTLNGTTYNNGAIVTIGDKTYTVTAGTDGGKASLTAGSENITLWAGLPKFEVKVTAAVISKSNDASYNPESTNAKAKLDALL